MHDEAHLTECQVAIERKMNISSLLRLESFVVYVVDIVVAFLAEDVLEYPMGSWVGLSVGSWVDTGTGVGSGVTVGDMVTKVGGGVGSHVGGAVSVGSE